MHIPKLIHSKKTRVLTGMTKSYKQVKLFLSITSFKIIKEIIELKDQLSEYRN